MTMREKLVFTHPWTVLSKKLIKELTLLVEVH